ncbi:MAG: exodeoxyribonuclease III [Nanoarchaeota archaeon]|nr:exodeoxyribonuclease III [Nanoarchaeota archaeon]
MRLISWNVNGLRAVLQKGFLQFVEQEDPEVICLQETKAQRDQVAAILQNYPHHFWNSAQKKGYSGTAIFSKLKPLTVTYDMPQHSGEGRIITAEFPRFFLVNVYTPNAQRGLMRLEYRQQWDKDFLQYIKQLEKKKPVIFCGDLNVAHQEIDLAHPKANRKNAGFTDEERAGFSRILDSGFLDTFRLFTKEPGHYTWWSYMFDARKNNVGWRIDYFCVSPALQQHVKESTILPHVMGSDHCPVRLVVEDK